MTVKAKHVDGYDGTCEAAILGFLGALAEISETNRVELCTPGHHAGGLFEMFVQYLTEAAPEHSAPGVSLVR